MKIIEGALKGIDGYLISIARDTVKGWYEIEVGLPSKWVFDENDKIGCEVLIDEKEGKLIRISPKNHLIVIDDLVGFVEIIIDVNQKIEEKEKQFTDTMEEMKTELEEKANDYFKELDDLRAESFKKVGGEFAESLKEPKSKRGRPKGSKNAPKVEQKSEVVVPYEGITNTKPTETTTVSEETTIVKQSKK